MDHHELAIDFDRPLTPFQHRYGPNSYAAATQRNWRLCHKCSCLHFAGNAVCAAGGVHDHSHNNTSFTLMTPSEDVDKKGGEVWKRCFKCQVIFKEGEVGGMCSGLEVHRGAHLGVPFSLFPLSRSEGEGSKNGEKWQYCKDCHGLALTSSPGACAAGEKHSLDASSTYILTPSATSFPSPSTPSTDNFSENWKHCSKCQLLAFDGYNSCSGGGPHTSVNSACYTLIFDKAKHGEPEGEHGWKLCSGCYCLVYHPSETTSTSSNPAISTMSCPKGGDHNLFPERDYILKTEKSQVSLLEDKWSRCKYCSVFYKYDLGNDEDDVGKCPGRTDEQKHVDSRLRGRSYWVLGSSTSDQELVCIYDGKTWRERGEGDKEAFDSDW